MHPPCLRPRQPVKTNVRFCMYDHGVPKRSQQYRDARREQILSAAKRCFVRDGFHETSMQDLFAEAGLSSGAVYRYFASKGDVIVAIAEENMREVAAAIGATAAHPQPEGIGSTLASVLDLIRRKMIRTRSARWHCSCGRRCCATPHFKRGSKHRSHRSAPSSPRSSRTSSATARFPQPSTRTASPACSSRSWRASSLN